MKVVVKMMQGQAIVTWLCHRPGRCSAVDGIQSEATLSLIEGGAIIVRRRVVVVVVGRRQRWRSQGGWEEEKERRMKMKVRGKGRERGSRGVWMNFLFLISFNFCGRRKELVVKLLVEAATPVTVLVLPVVKHSGSGTVTVLIPFPRPDL